MAAAGKDIVLRVFPARAGVIRRQKNMSVCDRGFPRTRGGDPLSLLVAAAKLSFSPHARG